MAATSPRHLIDALYQDVQQTLPFLQVRLEKAQSVLNVEERQVNLDQIHILFKDTEQLFQRLESERDVFHSDEEFVEMLEESRLEFDRLWSILRSTSDDCEKIINRAHNDAGESESLLRATQATMVNIDLSEALVSTLQQQREAILDAHEKNAAVQSKLDASRRYESQIEQIHGCLNRAWKSVAAVLVGIIFMIVYLKWFR